MLFNSVEFSFFLPIVFFFYWIVAKGNLKLQNLILLCSSYFFYGWWDWRFLFLMFFSSIVDYTIGLKLENTESQKKRRFLLYASIFVNIGLLGFFKYYNFFIESFQNAFQLFGSSFDASPLDIVLPVGISFYTFQTMSYTIDIYNKKLVPTRDPINFFVYVSFFPQLVAGPIERASNLIPQFSKEKSFDNSAAISGFNQIIWGLFKKIVIADSLAPVVDNIFDNFEALPGGTLFLGCFFFAIQIYCDFSGYSDVAIGTAKLFGINLMTNFKFPYFARNIGEFWRRWHISLSTWFRDYIYIPLGGSQTTKIVALRNIFIIFLVSGFWHGANATFIVWGLAHALLFVPSFVFGTNRKYQVEKSFRVIHVPQIMITFLLVCLTWVFFRAETITDSLNYFNRMFSEPSLPLDYKFQTMICIIFIIMDYMKMNFKIGNQQLAGVIHFILFILTLYNFKEAASFIYFQF